MTPELVALGLDERSCVAAVDGERSAESDRGRSRGLVNLHLSGPL